MLDLIESVASSAGIRRQPHQHQEILERTIYALINEGARVLEAPSRRGRPTSTSFT